MNKYKAKEIFQNIVKNNQILESCPLHDFIQLEIGEKQISGIEYRGTVYGKIFKCKNCGGQVSFESKQWYEIGLRHRLTPN